MGETERMLCDEIDKRKKLEAENAELRAALITDRTFIDLLAGHGLGNARDHQKHHPLGALLAKHGGTK